MQPDGANLVHLIQPGVNQVGRWDLWRTRTHLTSVSFCWKYQIIPLSSLLGRGLKIRHREVSEALWERNMWQPEVTGALPASVTRREGPHLWPVVSTSREEDQSWTPPTAHNRGCQINKQTYTLISLEQIFFFSVVEIFSDTTPKISHAHTEDTNSVCRSWNMNWWSVRRNTPVIHHIMRHYQETWNIISVVMMYNYLLMWLITFIQLRSIGANEKIIKWLVLLKHWILNNINSFSTYMTLISFMAENYWHNIYCERFQTGDYLT